MQKHPKLSRPHQARLAHTQQRQTTQQVQFHQQKIHTGPLPTPEDLQQYDLILPGAAERIINMAEIEQQHRHDLERKATTSELETREILQATEKVRIGGIMRSDGRGQMLGALVSFLSICGAIYLAKSQPWVAGTLIGLPLLGIVKTLRNGPTKHPTDKNTSD